MGFLALVAVALALVPVCFDVSNRVEDAVDVAQWLIIAIFSLEYGVGLFRAPSRKAYALDPWRILDLIIIVAPMASLLPNVSGELRSSPGLRLIRLVRVVLLGARIGGIMARAEARRTMALPRGPLEVSVVRGAGRHTPEPSTWGDFLQWVKEPGEEWYHVSNLGPEHLGDAAMAVGLPASFLETHLLEAGYPRLQAFERFSALFVWLPSMFPGTEFGVHRNGLLLLATSKTLFTFSGHSTDLQAEVAATFSRVSVPESPFPSRVVLAFLRVVLDRNEEVVGHFERELARLEEVPVRESRPDFLERTFRLKKELSAAQSDLWRLKGLLAALAENRATLPGIGAEARELFLRGLVNDAEYLYETVVNTREGLLSLIDLHLNVVSFEMNRVMRVLAMVSVLGLIPAVIGGLLGMNLVDNPWPFTLPQIAFGVLTAMTFCFYFFFVKGWLR